jgi:hypothetical protein
MDLCEVEAKRRAAVLGLVGKLGKVADPPFSLSLLSSLSLSLCVCH